MTRQTVYITTEAIVTRKYKVATELTNSELMVSDPTEWEEEYVDVIESDEEVILISEVLSAPRGVDR